MLKRATVAAIGSLVVGSMIIAAQAAPNMESRTHELVNGKGQPAGVELPAQAKVASSKVVLRGRHSAAHYRSSYIQQEIRHAARRPEYAR